MGRFDYIRLGDHQNYSILPNHLGGIVVRVMPLVWSIMESISGWLKQKTMKMVFAASLLNMLL